MMFISVLKVLEKLIIQGKENPWFTLSNIVFDYDEQNAQITYTLNGANYLCIANIGEDIQVDFGVANWIVDFSNIDNVIINVLVFVIGFCNEYTLGRGLELASKNQRNIQYMGLQLNFRQV